MGICWLPILSESDQLNGVAQLCMVSQLLLIVSVDYFHIGIEFEAIRWNCIDEFVVNDQMWI